MRLALKAKKVWQTDRLFNEWCHEDGMGWESDPKPGRILAGYHKQLGAGEEYEPSKQTKRGHVTAE